MIFRKSYGILQLKHGCISISPLRFGRGLLEAIGLAWLIIEPIAFFNENVAALFKQYASPIFWLTVLSAILWALYRSAEILSEKARIANTDIDIEVVVSDLFAFQADSALIISTNNTFDVCTDDDIISPSSLQGVLCRKLYNGSWRDMDADVVKQLETRTPIGEHTDGRRTKPTYYRIGTTIQVKRNDWNVYLLAVTEMRSNAKAHSDFNQVKDALTELWQYISNDGDKGHLSIPLLGTGNGRSNATREETIEAIVQSFIAASSQSTKVFCNHLRIVVGLEDYARGDVNLTHIGETLRCLCRMNRPSRSAGTGIELS